MDGLVESDINAVDAAMERGNAAMWRAIGYRMWVEGRSFHLIATEEFHRRGEVGNFVNAVDGASLDALRAYHERQADYWERRLWKIDAAYSDGNPSAGSGARGKEKGMSPA